MYKKHLTQCLTYSRHGNNSTIGYCDKFRVQGPTFFLGKKRRVTLGRAYQHVEFNNLHISRRRRRRWKKRRKKKRTRRRRRKEKRREYKMKLGWVLGCQIYIFPSKGDNDQKNIPFGVFIFVCYKPLCHGWHLLTSCIWEPLD